MSDREIMDAKFVKFGSWEKKPQVEHLFGKDIRKLPNPKYHQIVSFIKSGVRILGYVLIPYSIPLSVSVLVLSEVVGIIEELV